MGFLRGWGWLGNLCYGRSFGGVILLLSGRLLLGRRRGGNNDNAAAGIFKRLSDFKRFSDILQAASKIKGLGGTGMPCQGNE
jgi:hypothetical protein